MKNNGYINNRIRMNLILKKNIDKNIVNNLKKTIKRNNSSQRYLGMYQNEKTINKNKSKNILTPDVNKKTIKKTNITFNDNKTLETNNTSILNQTNDKNKNNNLNILSNSFDISTSFNIIDYMNLYYNSGIKNPFINKVNEKEKNIKEKIIAKYSFKNKNGY